MASGEGTPLSLGSRHSGEVRPAPSGRDGAAATTSPAGRTAGRTPKTSATATTTPTPPSPTRAVGRVGSRAGVQRRVVGARAGLSPRVREVRVARMHCALASPSAAIPIATTTERRSEVRQSAPLHPSARNPFR
eukprot:5489865-Alexandrium_andersonii.AAC.2